MASYKLRSLIVGVVVTGMSLAGVTNASAGDNTVLFGGTGNPSAAGMELMLGGSVDDDSNSVQHVWTTNEFMPSYGGKTFDTSRGEVVNQAEQALATTPGPKRAVAYSQTASALSGDMPNMVASGVMGPSDEVIYIANSRTRVSGVESRWSGLSVIGATAMGPALPTSVPATYHCRQYDVYCHCPEQWNLAMAFNAAASVSEIHPFYNDLDPAQARVHQVGNETYLTYPTAVAPGITLLERHGVYLSPQDKATFTAMVAMPDPGPGAPMPPPPPPPAPVVIEVSAPLYHTAPAVWEPEPPVQRWVDQTADAAKSVAPAQSVAIDQAAQQIQSVVTQVTQDANAFLNGLFPR